VEGGWQGRRVNARLLRAVVDEAAVRNLDVVDAKPGNRLVAEVTQSWAPKTLVGPLVGRDVKSRLTHCPAELPVAHRSELALRRAR
jgi:hypothetical protein